jgi:hypothetical protein
VCKVVSMIAFADDQGNVDSHRPGDQNLADHWNKSLENRGLDFIGHWFVVDDPIPAGRGHEDFSKPPRVNTANKGAQQ